MAAPRSVYPDLLIRHNGLITSRSLRKKLARLVAITFSVDSRGNTHVLMLAGGTYDRQWLAQQSGSTMSTSTQDFDLAISKAIQVMEVFRDMDATMPIAEAMSFLLLANEDEDTTLQHVGDQLGFSLSTASRHVQALGKFDRNNEPGLELLTDPVDGNNRRKKTRLLTPKGRLLVERLVHILKST